ncbi:hypothetical protein CKO28_06350 [Rhodovibrio sodomensis]|uniref:site-specific DNA-methyltransferase (adenine-specific) n=1 Tax=Rhodovibrio sodomensis TaxID=1088 RepID=A0ABS1DDH9_9PROT|nr:N-6 DNA methylase [Rhodovibrio sodomensis]MBK1667653.1 hypothetical protein [Rhodovibrio sodomensis]
MPEKIKDYATGKPVTLGPEEHVRQQLEHILIDELGYPKELIEIEFPIQRGYKKGNEKADIIIFHSAEYKQNNAYMVIETEPPGHEFDDQVFSYITATTAEFAVWFDGLDPKRSRGAEYRWRDLAHAPTTFQEIPALPRHGETLEEIGKYRKDQLKPARSLKGIFQKMHNRLYGDGPLKREDLIAQEVIKLLFCKLYDELYTPGDKCEFRATVHELQSGEGRKRVGDRVRILFDKLKHDPSYADMFEADAIQYDDYWIAYVVSELQSIGLTHEETDADAMGDAYEIFIGPQLKGESGQFFTPRPVVRLAVEILAPSLSERETVLDPACGSGGFLTYAFRHVISEANALFKGKSEAFKRERIREYANNFLYGLDIEPLLVKVCKSYMAIVGDGKSGIFLDNSLAPVQNWAQETKTELALGTFDVVITNPPFGTRIKVEQNKVLKQFDLGHDLKAGQPKGDSLKNGQDPAILYIERCRDFLKPPTKGKRGGRMAIVLPRQILSGHDQNMVQIRRWMLRHFKILAVVDLPPETFQPYTGTITSLVFAERKEEDKEVGDYDIFMAVAQYVGHDRRGNPMLARNDEGNPKFDANNNEIVLDDLPDILDAYREYTNGADPNACFDGAFRVNFSRIRNQPGSRIDAWFYDPSKNEVVKQVWDLAAQEGVAVKTIGELIEHPGDVFYPGRHKRNYCEPGSGALPFLSGTNVLQVRPFDVKWQPRAYKAAWKHVVDKGWILVTRSGSVGRVVFVGDVLAGFPVKDGVAVSEHVIRIIPDEDEVHPGYLFAFLASETGKILLGQGIYASVVQHITPDHVKAIPVPIPDEKTQKEIGEAVYKAERQRAEIFQLTNEAITSIDGIVAEGDVGKAAPVEAQASEDIPDGQS